MEQASSINRCVITITGLVQGVGFRPFVHRLATRFNLTGFIRNSPAGVEIEIQGDGAWLEDFLRALRAEAPAESRIAGIDCRPLPPKFDHDPGFAILASHEGGAVQAAVPPDLGTCPVCQAEIRDPKARRHRYPFTNCTHCGPRFTIIRGLPYDRPGTTMADFELCAECAREYGDPADRRFHAQPIACPDCGPALQLLAVEPETGRLSAVSAADPLRRAQELLQSGGIMALKGLGGFHLAGDAANEGAIRRIRAIKAREAKPFALMCRDVAQIRTFCELTDGERAALESPARPIVILRRQNQEEGTVCGLVAPGQDTLGVMLPYTPLHHLLLDGLPHPLVMTSANLGDEPIAKDEAELDDRVRRESGLILTHNRPIHARCDDSVLIAAPVPIVLRRSRGYVPTPVAVTVRREALGVGGDQKNTVCFVRDGQAFLSQHVGNIEDEGSLRAQAEALANLQGLFGFAPEAVGCDLHPGYRSREAARTAGVPIIEIQHHHAHIASCLAENRVTGPVLGVAFDGTGYGPDGTVWGGEFLLADLAGYTRIGSLRPVALPGGEKAVREPWRMALSYLLDAFGENLPDFPGAGEIHARGSAFLIPLIREGLNAPPTSSAGRLFDAVAALLGLGLETSFEGQAAMALETLAGRCLEMPEVCPFAVEEEQGRLCLDFRPSIQAIVRDLRDGCSRVTMAMAFHRTAAAGLMEVCRRLRERTGLNQVALSGGVFQNGLLLGECLRVLSAANFKVFRQRQVPPNDGGISLGQAAIASARLEGQE